MAFRSLRAFAPVLGLWQWKCRVANVLKPTAPATVVAPVRTLDSEVLADAFQAMETRPINRVRMALGAYLRACADAGIQLLELGFRFMPDGRFFGAHAHATDEFLRSLDLPNGVDIAVMVNAKELLAHKSGPVAAVDALFNERSKSWA